MKMFEIKDGVWINLDKINRIRIAGSYATIEYVNKDYQTIELDNEEETMERLRAFIREANIY
jgi:hypothetical protein